MPDTNSTQQNSGKYRKQMRRFLAGNSWLIIGVAAIVTFFLGMIGFYQLYLIEEKSYTWWDLIYSSLRLFRSDNGVPFGAKPWLLELARGLATVITLMAAIKALILFFSGKAATAVAFFLEQPCRHLRAGRKRAALGPESSRSGRAGGHHRPRRQQR
jgi:hypothetical protein